MNINESVALITGGSEGIGYGIAEALKREGALVTITARREDVLRAAAEKLGVDWICGDVGVEKDVVRTVAGVVEKHGRLDILVNNAGFGRFAPLVEMELADFDAVYKTNVYGAFLMGRESARQFVRQFLALLLPGDADARLDPRRRREQNPAAAPPCCGAAVPPARWRWRGCIGARPG